MAQASEKKAINMWARYVPMHLYAHTPAMARHMRDR